MTDVLGTDAIGELVRPVLTGLGYDLEDLVARTAGGRRELRIVVDRDGGASLDALAEASREVAAVLDDAELYGEEPYELELTTPGIDRPLTEPRHWRRARGRKVTVRHRTEDGEQTLTARVGDSDENSVTLISNNKGRFTETALTLDAVVEAAMEVDFTRPGEAELRRCGLDDDEIAVRRRPAE